MVIMPSGAPGLDEILIQTDALPWREKSLKGVSEKMLWRNEATGASIALIKFDKALGIPAPHYHASNQFMFCLKGRYEYTENRRDADGGFSSTATRRATCTGRP